MCCQYSPESLRETICRFPGFSVHVSLPRLLSWKCQLCYSDWLPELAILLLWFSESPSLHLCLPSLHHRLETLKAADWSSHWVHPIWFQYLMDHCPKLLDGQSFKNCCFIYFICFIIFWCFRWEDKFRTCYSRLPQRGPYNVLGLILKFPVWFFSLIQVYLRVDF